MRQISGQQDRARWKFSRNSIRVCVRATEPSVNLAGEQTFSLTISQSIVTIEKFADFVIWMVKAEREGFECVLGAE